MTPDDIKSVTTLQVQMSDVKGQIEKMDSKMDRGFDDLHEKIDRFIDASDSRFADKWVQTAVQAVIGVVGTIVVGSIIYSVIQK